MGRQKHNGATLTQFANRYCVKTVEEGNDKGSWYSYSVSLESKVTSIEVYREAKEMYGSINRGELRLAPPPEQLAVEQTVSDDSIPF